MNGFSNPSPPGTYYTYDIEVFDKNNENFIYDDFKDDVYAENYLNNENLDYENRLFLGLGDFSVFNLMVLFIPLPTWSLTIKILVVFGCIISIQVGQCSTAYIHRLWQLAVVPGLPFSVITFSVYAVILNVIIEYTNHDC